MRRRAFISLLGGAAAWPLAARAQQAERMRLVSMLMAYTEGDLEAQTRIRAFRLALQELGWTEGRNIRLVYRWASGNAELRQRYAAELVDQRPDAILANTAPVAAALMRATSNIPIVYAVGADPMASGLVTNLARPDGNLTGFSVTEPSLGSKWLDLLRELSPTATAAGIVHDPANPVRQQYLRAIEHANRELRLELTQFDTRDGTQIGAAIDAFARSGAGRVLLVMPGAATAVHRAAIISAAARNRVPAIYPTRFYAADGGLASYGADYTDIFRRAASYVDRILRGEKPGDLPIQQPTKFELVINLKTAKALGLEVSPTLLARADEVIE
jgi:putative tryptophan/tyrosine transport system substrate-binding protein